jgi:hypothetical protein
MIFRRGDRAKVDAMVRHLACGHDLQEFPGTTYENLGLVEKAAKRGLVEWQKERRRYELTPIGWRYVTPGRRLGLPFLAVGAAIGAAIGAAALAFAWLPADALHRFIPGRAAPPAAQAATPAVAAPPPAAAAAVNGPAPPATAAATNPAPAQTAHAAPGTPGEPAAAAAQPAPEQPAAEATPADVKPAPAKRSRPRTLAHQKREQTGPNWSFFNFFRSNQSKNSRPNSWFANQ